MKLMRKLLFPFAAIYFLVMLLRNWFYELGLFASTSYAFPVICIGNLNTGGTGKSPMTEYLIRTLQDTHKTTVLSRGYGRKSRGYIQVTPNKSAIVVGDEPLQFAKKFPKTTVVVCEDRRAGIAQITSTFGAPEVLILDDAFQHRGVRAGFNIVLTAYDDLFIDDYLLPAGNLREPRNGSKRADVIVVTKCPSNLNIEEQQCLTRRIGGGEHQKVFYASIIYANTVKGDDQLDFSALRASKIRVLTGIANPSQFIAHLKSEGLDFDHLAFGDHHNFTESEIQELDQEGVILTTEKDFVRLDGRFSKTRLYYLPIETRLLTNAVLFNSKILDFVAKS
ncbi:MAG: tetraacyldisaccharide 4'-kinase [Flavobacteriales bacterium]|jgi:tetraacyldisaccharide 4'-kinase